MTSRHGYARLRARLAGSRRSSCGVPDSKMPIYQWWYSGATGGSAEIPRSAVGGAPKSDPDQVKHPQNHHPAPASRAQTADQPSTAQLAAAEAQRGGKALGAGGALWERDACLEGRGGVCRRGVISGLVGARRGWLREVFRQLGDARRRARRERSERSPVYVGYGWLDPDLPHLEGTV